MKIRTNLFLLSAIFVILIAALGLIVLQSFSQINREIKGSNSADRMIKDIFELNIVTYEYIMHHEKRMQQQWMLKYDSIGKLLERMRKEESHPECQSILESMTFDYKALGNLFSQLQSNFVKRKRLIEENRSQVEINMTFALEERLIAQALMRAQKITSGAFRSSIIMQQRIARVQQRTNLIVLFSIIGFIILSSCVSFLITRSITRPLNKLVKSAEIIGEGNLKHRVEIKTKNEIGELGAAFNRMTERRQLVEERLEHLNALLRAIRSVNQLIAREKDRKRLLQRACESLVGSDVFYNAWIVLMDGSGKLVSATEAGLGNDFLTMVQGLKGGEMADCIRQALSQPGVVTVDDPFSACTNCPLAKKYAGRGAMSLRLEHGGRVYGVIAVSILKDLFADDKAIGLFTEIGDDIAFALHGIEMEEAQRRAEEALRASEEKYRNIFENVSDFIYIHDLEGLFKETNLPFIEEMGYIEDDFVNINVKDLIPERYKHQFEDYLKEVIEKGKSEGLMRIMTKDGDERIVEYKNSLVYDKTGPIGVRGSARDVTERKQAEEELLKSEQRYRTLFEDSIDAVYITTRDGKFIDANQSGLDLFGYSREEMASVNALQLYVHPSDAGKFEKEIGEKGFLRDYEITFRKKDGTEMDCLLNTTLRRANDGSILAYQGIIRDITEQKKLEAQFRQAQKMEAIGILAGGVAHDFNNILTTIIGNASLALMKVSKDDPLREEIEEIREAGERAASLTRQLLAFSRKQIIRPEILDLNELLTDIEKMLGRLIGEDIELLTIPGPELWQVEADPGQIEQVIMNIAINARDAMPKGGKLTVETANVDVDGSYFRKHGIKEKQPGTYIMLAVSDTGIGMDKETQEHIFEPFFTTKEIGKGTGLGLSTVYGIVKQNNGFIWVYSEPGQGSIFKIYLPKAKGDVASEKKEQHPVIELGGSETVLIVEDDDSLRKLARTVLKQRGYKVLEAENGEDALRVSEAHDGSIDLLIADVVMPKMGGKETAERLQPLYPQMKVIYMSGYTDNAILHHGVLAPGLNFFEKPFTPEGLARKVREILDTE